MSDLTELATLMRRVVQSPHDELAIQRLKARLRRSHTAEFTKALILVMLVERPQELGNDQRR